MQYGSVALLEDDDVLLLLRPPMSFLREQAKYAHLFDDILRQTQANAITIIDDYNPALYLSTAPAEDDIIRYISTQEGEIPTGQSSSSLRSFDSPNYVLGLAAALMNEVRSGIMRPFRSPVLLFSLPVFRQVFELCLRLYFCFHLQAMHTSKAGLTSLPRHRP